MPRAHFNFLGENDFGSSSKGRILSVSGFIIPWVTR